MRKSVSLVAICLVLFVFGLKVESEESLPPPLPPDSGTKTALAAPVGTTPPAPTREIPTRLSIPSIVLNTTVIAMGINKEGEMDVPSGRGKSVGWYKYGAAPGEVGSAVLDAHVYAAFSKLKNVQIGQDIYTSSPSGKKQHFKVTHSMIYKVGDVPRELLFNRQGGGKHLHLITCHGTFSKKMNTYTHRLIVYATLVEE
mgnify:CR=1 FL=1